MGQDHLLPGALFGGGHWLGAQQSQDLGPRIRVLGGVSGGTLLFLVRKSEGLPLGIEENRLNKMEGPTLAQTDARV